MQDYFKVKDFPKNMPAIWEAHWGFAQKQTGSAVVIGEWGGW
jgi:endoglucanase